MEIIKRVDIYSDYTPLETPNILCIIVDDQGDVHIHLDVSEPNYVRRERGVRIAVSGTRFHGEVREAFYRLIDELIDKEHRSTLPKHVELQSDYSENLITLMQDEQGDVHISLYVPHINFDNGETSVRIAVFGTRHEPIVRTAIYKFVDTLLTLKTGEEY